MSTPHTCRVWFAQVSAGMAIYDTMQFVPCDVSTVCFGQPPAPLSDPPETFFSRPPKKVSFLCVTPNPPTSFVLEIQREGASS